MISTIIATYNRAAYVVRAIESVLAQKIAATEIIVIDDGSTDATREALNVFGEKIRYFYQQNRERGAARNLGLRNAHGEFVHFLDSDDLLPPAYYQTVLEAFGQHRDLALVCSSYHLIDENDRVFATVKPRAYSGRVFERLLINNFICNSSAVVRRECIEAVGGFNENRALSGSEDWELWLRLASRYRILHLPEQYIFFRSHPGNWTKHAENVERSMLCAMEIIGKEFPQVDLKRLHAHTLTHIAVAYRIQGRLRESRRRLLEAVRAYPALCFQSRWLQTFLRTFVHR